MEKRAEIVLPAGSDRAGVAKILFEQFLDKSRVRAEGVKDCTDFFGRNLMAGHNDVPEKVGFFQ
jgi:hypothetical protein